MFNMFTITPKDGTKQSYQIPIGKKDKSGKIYEYKITTLNIVPKDKITKEVKPERIGKYKINFEIDDMKIMNDTTTTMFTDTITTQLNHEIDPMDKITLQLTDLTVADGTLSDEIDFTFLVEYNERKK